jgi:hypothetical protein
VLFRMEQWTRRCRGSDSHFAGKLRFCLMLKQREAKFLDLKRGLRRLDRNRISQNQLSPVLNLISVLWELLLRVYWLYQAAYWPLACSVSGAQCNTGPDPCLVRCSRFWTFPCGVLWATVRSIHSPAYLVHKHKKLDHSRLLLK